LEWKIFRKKILEKRKYTSRVYVKIFFSVCFITLELMKQKQCCAFISKVQVTENQKQFLPNLFIVLCEKQWNSCMFLEYVETECALLFTHCLLLWCDFRAYSNKLRRLFYVWHWLICNEYMCKHSLNRLYIHTDFALISVSELTN
jgi:hypothetical protein